MKKIDWKSIDWLENFKGSFCALAFASFVMLTLLTWFGMIHYFVVVTGCNELGLAMIKWICVGIIGFSVYLFLRNIQKSRDKKKVRT
jgi:hypothetical protein